LNALLDGSLLSDLIQRFMLFLDVVIIFVIDVNVCPLHVCETFEFTLQGLADIVSDLEGKTLVHNDIDFNVILLTGVVCAALFSISG
jgi:hypothetical protein